MTWSCSNSILFLSFFYHRLVCNVHEESSWKGGTLVQWMEANLRTNKKQQQKNERKIFRSKTLFGGLREIKKNQQKLGASCRMNKTLFPSIKTFESKTITIWNDVWPFFFSLFSFPKKKYHPWLPNLSLIK